MTNLWTAALKTHQMLSALDMSSVYRPMVPLHHMLLKPSKQTPVVKVELNLQGDVIQVSSETECHFIPSTLKSASRTNSGIAHPLVDKVCYMVDVKFKSALEAWVASTNNEYLEAVLRSLPGLVHLSSKKDGSELSFDLLKLSKKKLKNAGYSQDDLKLTVGGLDVTSDTFVTWEIDGLNLADELQQNWVDYYSEQIKVTNPEGLCFISGEHTNLIQDGEFPKMLPTHAKMVSCDDNTGLTYRGRFYTATQSWGTGIVPALKVNASISFLLNNFALYANSTRTVVWCDSQVLISELNKAHNVFNPDKNVGKASTAHDMKVRGSFENLQKFYERGLRLLQGYRVATHNPSASVYILSSTQTEKGSVSNTLFEQLSMSQYLENLQAWQRDAGWFYHNKNVDYVGAPTTNRLLAFFAPDPTSTTYKVNKNNPLLDRIQNSAVNAILLGQPIPSYWVKEAVARVSRVFFTPLSDRGRKDRIEETFFMVCALTRAYFNRHPNPSIRKELPVGLDLTSTDYSYLMGRYCALASFLEGRVLFKTNTNKGKPTRATFVEQQFVWCSSQSPKQVMGSVAKRLNPYLLKFPYLRSQWSKKSSEITDTLTLEDVSRKVDNSIFMLGFSAQTKSLWEDLSKRKAEKEAKKDASSVE